MAEIFTNPSNPDMRIVVDRPPHTDAVGFSIEYREHGRWGAAAGTRISPHDARTLSKALIRMAAHAEAVGRK